MSGSLTRGGGENVPGIPQFCVYGKRPMGKTVMSLAVDISGLSTLAFHPYVFMLGDSQMVHGTPKIFKCTATCMMNYENVDWLSNIASDLLCCHSTSSYVNKLSVKTFSKQGCPHHSLTNRYMYKSMSPHSMSGILSGSYTCHCWVLSQWSYDLFFSVNLEKLFNKQRPHDAHMTSL